MTISEPFVEAGVQITYENKPEGNPTKGAFARVIDAVRKAESIAASKLNDANERGQDALTLVGILTEKLQKAEAELLKNRLEKQLEADAYQKLNPAEKQQLLEVVT